MVPVVVVVVVVVVVGGGVVVPVLRATVPSGLQSESSALFRNAGLLSSKSHTASSATRATDRAAELHSR